VNPGLVWCSLSGFGQTGPKRDHAGHDITYLGHAGVLGLMTDVDEVPDQPRCARPTDSRTGRERTATPDLSAFVARIAAALAYRPAAHWADVLGGAGVAMVNEPGDLIDDPQVRAATAFHRGGRRCRPGRDQPTAVLVGRRMEWAPPMGFSAPGDDTDAVLTGAGFAADDRS
jgi:crotonobetainyl-CoA:carnitine CoA-transferase CaiB-like acyl-CoA transferase